MEFPMSERGDIQLNRFWNQLVQVGDALADDLDPESAALIRRMHALANAPLPVSARERVWRGLLDAYEPMPEETESTMFTATDLVRPSPFVINGHAPRLHVLNPPQDRSRWLARPLAYLAVAALLLTMIGAAAAVRFTSWGDSPEPSKGGPAIFAPASPSPEAAGEEILLEVTLPADVVPAGMLGSMLLSRDTIPANSVTTRTSWECCPGAKIFLILDGSVSVTSDGTMQIFRHDRPGEIETMANGSEADLGPGDAVAMRNEASQTWTTGAGEVDIVTQTLIAGSVPGSHVPAEWVVNTYTSDANTIDLPGGPYRLSLRQVTVDADAEFPPPENGVNQLGILRDGQGVVGRDSDGTISVQGVRGPATIFILTLTTLPEGIGTPLAGMNAIAPQASLTP
jgi:hypothetical protein